MEVAHHGVGHWLHEPLLRPIVRAVVLWHRKDAKEN